MLSANFCKKRFRKSSGLKEQLFNYRRVPNGMSRRKNPIKQAFSSRSDSQFPFRFPEGIPPSAAQSQILKKQIFLN